MGGVVCCWVIDFEVGCIDVEENFMDYGIVVDDVLSVFKDIFVNFVLWFY